MTLLDYIKTRPEGDEITVLDNVYDIEVYFYNQLNDAWDDAMMRLADNLNVLDIDEDRDAVTVDLSRLIENHIYDIADSNLFYYTDVDTIMDDMENILAGNVPEDWFVAFVRCLS